MNAPFLSRLSRRLLGSARKRQARAAGALISGATYAVMALLMLGQARLGLAPWNASVWLSTGFMAAWAVFFMLIRSGYSERWSDPGLTVPQMVFGMAVVALSYAMGGPARGAQMALVVMVMVFGIFNLPERSARWIAGFMVAMFAGVMGWKAATDPAHFPVTTELMHFGFVALAMAASLLLVSRMAGMRVGYMRQRAELQSAMQQIRLLAIQDELTGLPNRRHMVELMAVEKARHLRSGRVMSLAMIDIDFFKRINDTYGHVGGDLVLKTFAQFSRASLRPSDSLARWGGEEFLLLLPETTLDDATLCVERMRSHFSRMSGDAISPGLQVTFSAGIATCLATDSIEDTVERADQAMYRAKVQGRNRSVVV